MRLTRWAVGPFTLISLLATLAGTALADEWLLDGAPITAAIAVDYQGQITMQDLSGTGNMTCDFSGSGTAGPGSADTVTSFTMTNCKGLGGCATVDSTAAVNLPWNTTVQLGGAVFFDLTSPGSAGKNPGFLVECTVLGLLTDDTCTRETEQSELHNLATDVEMLRNTKEKLNCTVGGAEKGELSGSSLVQRSGDTLQVS